MALVAAGPPDIIAYAVLPAAAMMITAELAAASAPAMMILFKESSP